MQSVQHLRKQVQLDTIPADVLDRWLNGDVPPEPVLPTRRTDELREQWRFLGYASRGVSEDYDAHS